MEAKPCPCCGQLPSIERGDYAWRVLCDHCCGGPKMATSLDSRDLAIAWWNMSVDECAETLAAEAVAESMEAARSRDNDRRIDEARGK